MTDTTAPAGSASGAAARPHYSERYKGMVLGLLVTAYTFSFIDRTIIATIGQAIKVDLKISDAQLGALGGLYFALLYTILGVPIARFAERFSRVNIISGAIVLWSAFTAACGFATNFVMLAAFRFGVGVGEAGLSPPAHSLISDYYEPKKRASALSIYAFGIPLGSMLGAIMGGWLTQAFSWRMAFMVVGVPGVLVALAIKLFIKEPPRGHSEPQSTTTLARGDLAPDEPAKPAPSLLAELSEMGAICKVLFGTWPVLNMVLGITLVSFAGYGGGQFAPPYFIRTFGLNYAEVGLVIGLASGFSQGIGTLLGGFVTDRLAKASARWYALVPAIGVTIAFPFVAAVYTAPSWQMAAAFLLVPGIFAYTYLGPTFGVVQNMFPTQRRATAAAVLLLFLNLIALGGGPLFAGWAIDQLAGWGLAHPGTNIWSAIGHLFSQPGGAFQQACPGGIAPKGAPGEAVAACKTALITGTRHGVILSYAFYLWGAFHYLIGSFGLSNAMAKARADRGEA